jgi:hypothetical protein
MNAAEDCLAAEASQRNQALAAHHFSGAGGESLIMIEPAIGVMTMTPKAAPTRSLKRACFAFVRRVGLAAKSRLAGAHARICS